MALFQRRHNAAHVFQALSSKFCLDTFNRRAGFRVA